MSSELVRKRDALDAKGTNRVGSGRLHQLAAVLEVPLMDFFKGEKASPTRHSSSPFALLDNPMSMQMLQAFSRISDKTTRRSVLALVEQLVITGKR
ncbi:MAG: hypothetical protein ABSC37_00225 [Xanthobacteraceae bacterium]